MLPKFRKEAQEELIEERLKLQEAKRQGIEISDDEVKRMMKTIAERNKMTEEQFAQHIKGLGVDISTMQERFTAPDRLARGGAQRRFSTQISITNRDIERMLSASASEAGEDTVELQVQKITLPMPASRIRARWPSVMPRRTACARSSAAARPWPAWRRRRATPGSRT